MDGDDLLEDGSDPLGQLVELCRPWEGYLLMQLYHAQRAAQAPNAGHDGDPGPDSQPETFTGLRRSELARLVDRAAGRRIAERVLTKTLDQLVKLQQITYHDQRGHKIYRLTTEGAARARRVRAQIAFDRSIRNEPPDAREWSRVLGDTSTLPLSAAEREQLLQQLASMLDPADPATGRKVGTELVHAGFTQPAALEATIMLLTQRSGVEPDSAQLLGGLAAAFVEALQDQLLQAQEWLWTAALNAASPHGRVLSRRAHPPAGGSSRTRGDAR